MRSPRGSFAVFAAFFAALFMLVGAAHAASHHDADALAECQVCLIAHAADHGAPAPEAVLAAPEGLFARAAAPATDAARVTGFVYTLRSRGPPVFSPAF
jgi:hypothetical protein